MPKRTKIQSLNDAAGQSRHVRTHHPEEFWRKHIAAWRSSGGTKRAYCTQHDVSYWSFIDWVRRIERRDKEKSPQQCGNPFVPIRVVQPEPAPAEESLRGGGETAGGGREIEIVLPSGALIRFHDNCDAVFVANLLSALKA